MIESRWLQRTSSSEICDEVSATLEKIGPRDRMTIGIDAPRQPLKERRPLYWDKKASAWRARRLSERGWGRHCEVIVASSGIARPQWTPPANESPKWMALGYSLFGELSSRGYTVHEVFPSAAYRLLQDDKHPPIAIDFSAFANGAMLVRNDKEVIRISLKAK